MRRARRFREERAHRDGRGGEGREGGLYGGNARAPIDVNGRWRAPTTWMDVGHGTTPMDSGGSVCGPVGEQGRERGEEEAAGLFELVRDCVP